LIYPANGAVSCTEETEACLCHGAVSTAAVALLARCSPVETHPNVLEERTAEAPPRYGCLDHTEYVQTFSLPPYVGVSSRA
jgi:hypothetical protein